MTFNDTIEISNQAIQFLLEVEEHGVISQNEPSHHYLFSSKNEQLNLARLECISKDLIKRMDSSKYEPIQYKLSNKGCSALYQYKSENSWERNKSAVNHLRNSMMPQIKISADFSQLLKEENK